MSTRPIGPAPRPVPAWLAVATAMLACGWGGNQFTPLLVMYRQVNGYSATVVDSLLGAYVLGLAPALLAGGPLSDRYGRRPVMLGALVSSAAGSAALAAGTLPSLAAGRLMSGVAVGFGMAVGTSWIVELSVAGGSNRARGARRASLALTAGFGAGAGVAGTLAQWGPWPETLPYLVQAVLALALLAPVSGCTETCGAVEGRRRPPGPRIPALRHRRFRRLVLPMAPWVFGAAGVAYAIVPQSMAGRVGHWSLLYATALTVATLGAGILVQPLARRLDHAYRPRSMVVAMAAVSAGLALAAAAVGARSPWAGALAAVVLGGAYGVALVAGLVEVQRISSDADRSAATGIYYALAYVGFLLPTGVAVAGRWLSTGLELATVAGLALACTLIIVSGRRLPAAVDPPHPSAPAEPPQLIGVAGASARR